MYTPAPFEESRPEVLRELIVAHPLGLLITLGAGGLDANSIPFEFVPEPASLGTLRAHVARANPVWKDFSRDVDTLVVFQGPQAYITPSWYVATKPATGMVVPTWNYCVVHARGRMRVIDDREWLRGMDERLTRRFESGRAKPWQITDAPADFIEKQLAAIVGIEITLTQLTGKWKVSQNRSAADRAGVVEGLRAEGTPDTAAMAALVSRRAGGAQR